MNESNSHELGSIIESLRKLSRELTELEQTLENMASGDCTNRGCRNFTEKELIDG